MKARNQTGMAKTALKDQAKEISASRKAAFQILLAVERRQSHSDDLLRGRAVNALSAPDRNLATALVLGVLRWQILLDRQIHALLARPNVKLDAEIRIALRMGAFQLLHMDRIPARAAIDESVELTKQAGFHFAAGMVNAVLRKLIAVPHSEFSEDSLGELALGQAHPAWMVERWISFYGVEAAQAICRHGQCQPALTVRMTDPTVAAEVTEAGIALETGELLTGAQRIVSGDLTATAAFRENRIRFQDEGSQLVAELASASSSRPVTSILDACAAPGGKTMILAERNPAARIVACESSATRIEQMRKRLAPFGDRIECRLADASALTDEAAYGLVLADVPCSGTGTLGRNPEIRHRLQLTDLARQAERQRAILAAALRAVRPGGRVVYSTCSLEPEENEQVVASVLDGRPDLRLIPLAACLNELRVKGILMPNGAERLQTSLTPEGCLRLLPGVFHTDGFFIALIERS
ncbi:MAG: transcription antitermination factor NusB [Terracidiphilus sp.]